ncbi:unnamed protein product [Candida verbasci]|uniref:Mitochondrial outer membrane transport complex Sam37/metaxin N-terminal domain-containing protein n=1 Tax=Candida verbasci TaxID=1227364 RepID=A0A9W4TTJ5_9ASCO|nr:unnamed protein product [Candida verbasci]
MLQLHVWGINNSISIISPECIAISWLISKSNLEYEVILSNNTNLSNLNKLPCLISETNQYNGFNEILNFIMDDVYTPKNAEDQLINQSLTCFILNNFEVLNQYNLFMNGKNYEKYTRKVIVQFYPFPMMFNKSLKLYNNAEQLVKLSGLGKKAGSGISFLKFANNEKEEEICQTETFNDELDDVDENEVEDEKRTKAISSLHEKQLLKKQQTKKILQESRSTMKCLNLLNQYLTSITKLKGDKKYLIGDKLSSSEILLAAYLFCLTSDQLPDRFIYNYLTHKTQVSNFIKDIRNEFNINVDEINKFRQPIGNEFVMKFISTILISCLLVGNIDGLTIAKQTTQKIIASPSSTSSIDLPIVTEEAVKLSKRMRDVIVNKDYQKQQEAKKKLTQSSTETPPPRWIRTRKDGRTEIVTPTIIQGVTFSARPPKTTDGLEPWVSLKDDGSPKTINPKYKNGRIKDGYPSYTTYFQQATTFTYNKEQLKAHNMAEDEIFTEIIYTEEEDLEDHFLNPIIRCTPDRYKMKGIGRDKSPEPFCTPKDTARLIMDKTYFVTWYSRFFDPTVKQIKLHFTNVKESLKEKGLRKREFNETAQEKGEKEEEEEEEEEKKDLALFDKRSRTIEKGGRIQDSFFQTEWLDNELGYYPLYINESFFDKSYTVFEKKVLISIQPDNIPDEEFDILKNSIVVEFSKGSIVSKGHLEDLKKLEEKYANRHMHNIEIEEGIDYEKYMVMLALPTCVLIAAVGMYFFVTINKIDLSHLKKTSFAGKKTTHRRIPFKTKKNTTALPVYKSDINGPKHD